MIAFVFAAVLTPPDLISQVGLGIPIIILYEISIFMARISERKRAKREAAEEAEAEAENDDDPEDDPSGGSSVAKSDDSVDEQGAAAASGTSI